ncbi:TPA: hypothetical protein ACH3X3_15261 [Trebouxia sp. C0006]
MGRHTCGAGRQQLLFSSSSSLIALQGAQITLGVWIVTGGAKILQCLPLIIFAVTANSLSDVSPRRQRQPLANQNTQSRASLLCCRYPPSCVSSCTACCEKTGSTSHSLGREGQLTERS